MKTRISLTLAIAAALLLAGCSKNNDAAPSAPAVSTRADTPRLHREGRWMVDEKNRIVLLHGINAVWKLAPSAPPDSALGFTAADADWLRDHGFNTVRLGTIFAGVMPQEGQIDQTYLNRVDRVVQLLASRGIWVMLDFHQDLYNERYGGEGFPAWATYDDGVPNIADVGFPGNYFLPGTTRAFDNLWGNKNALWDHYRDAWKAVAGKWKNQPYLMGYDLINEPFPGMDLATCAGPLGCPIHDDQKLQAFQSHVLKGIREVDSNNLVWLEPNIVFDFGAKSNLGLITKLTDPQLGFSWHTYCLPAALLHAQGVNDVPGCAQLHGLVFGNAEEAIARMGATTLLTEFGASDDLPDITNVTALADSQLTGWQYWHYKGWNDPTSEDPTGGAQSMFVKDDDLGSVKLDKLKLLERTYPQATAGVPISLAFDPVTAEFEYHYTPRAADGPTEIHVPVALHYPAGYVVDVTGATVASAANAGKLTLRNNAGASEVVVRVRRR